MKERAIDQETPIRRPVADGVNVAAEVNPLQRAVDASPVQAAQRARIAGAFGPVAQREEEPNRTGMPDNLKSGIESMSGMDMSDVRVHRNSPQPRDVSALAYAQGNDIHLGPGQEKHLPHEAWHLVQQRQGRVQPTTQVGGVNVNDDPGLEREADVMGARAASAQAKREDGSR
jgi:hypothetical protein